MPSLSTRIGLLTLVLAYCFVVRYLGGKFPAVKRLALPLFIMMTGISNRQHYSFAAMIDGSLMILLSGMIVTVVYMLFAPMRPERIIN